MQDNIFMMIYRWYRRTQLSMEIDRLKRLKRKSEEEIACQEARLPILKDSDGQCKTFIFRKHMEACAGEIARHKKRLQHIDEQIKELQNKEANGHG
jgi:uncharacterized membrane protein YgaE (UPF0421/DUF939 family)